MKTMDLQFVKDSLAELGLNPGGESPDGAYRTALVVVSALACGLRQLRSLVRWS